MTKQKAILMTEQFPRQPMDLCFIDTETISLRSTDEVIWEFAGIRRNVETGAETRMLLQIETNLGEADPFSLKIGGYHDRFGESGEWNAVEEDGNWPQKGEVVFCLDAARHIEKFTRGAILIANCITFDEPRLAMFLRANLQCPSWHYHALDIEGYVAGYLKAERGELLDMQPPFDSETLSEALGVALPTEEERHTAMGDAEWVMREWDAVFGAK